MSLAGWIFLVGMRVFDLGGMIVWLVWYFRQREDDDWPEWEDWDRDPPPDRPDPPDPGGSGLPCRCLTPAPGPAASATTPRRARRGSSADASRSPRTPHEPARPPAPGGGAAPRAGGRAAPGDAAAARADPGARLSAAGGRGEPLPGGDEHAGAVFRLGDRVERPVGPHAASVHALLRTLRRAGFDGAPLPVSRDERTETLLYVPGEVPLPPLPRWAAGEPALRSVAALLRRLHRASEGFAAGVGADGSSWSSELADPHGGPLICHNDVCPQNVVFRDGRAFALLDFDFAAPGRGVYDLAMTAKLWLALGLPGDHTRGTVEPERGLRVLAEGYGLPEAERPQLIAALGDAIAVGDAFLARRVERGDPAYLAMGRRRPRARRPPPRVVRA